MTDPVISVVVPFYNNADLLGDCLASIAAQTYPALEVIMVDDGSTDGGAAVATAQAAADPRFTLVSVPNGGPGSARNHGISAAGGEFLAFVDADDLLPPDAYATMIAVLERTGSDFVSGGVLRLTAAGLGRSGLHAKAIRARRLRTRIARSPELFYDISVWNKLFRRSFWDAAGLRFPEGMLWEDLVAMTRAHVLATSVDVITEPVYRWRDRDSGGPSITQSRADAGNIRDRVTALTMIDDFLRQQGTPAMLRAHQHKALVNDLWLYVRDLPATSRDYQREFAGLTAAYLAQVTPGLAGELPSTHKLAYYLISQGRLDDLITYAAWLTALPGRTPPLVRSRGRLVADLPLREPGGGIPASVFRPQWRELDPHVGVDALSWQGRSLRIEGWAYVPSRDIGRRRDATKLVLLVPRGGRRRPPLIVPARQVRRPDITEASGQDRYRYDWAGFRCDLPVSLLRAGGRWLAGSWDCYVLVRGRTSWRPARLHTAGPPPADPGPREVAPGLTLAVRWSGGRLQLRLGPGDAGAGGAAVADGVAGADGAGGREGVVAGHAGSPVVVAGDGALPGFAAPKTAEPAVTADPGVTAEATWNADGELVLRGVLPEPAPDLVELRLRYLDGWDAHVLPVQRNGARFSAVVPAGAIESFGDRAPLRDGRWELTLRGPGGPIALRLAGAQDRPVTAGRKVYGLSQAGGKAGALVLTAGPALGLAERGRVRRKLIREVHYRLQRLLPVRDQILFASYHGKQTGDSPRAIADELRRRGDPRRHVWAIADWAVPVPPGADAVLTGTVAYFRALARSRYLVLNDHVARPYRKRRGQFHAQTWHGTPLKRVGYDIGVPSMASGRGFLDYMAADVAQWDLLLSPNPFSTPIWRRAFGYHGEICETGYPRNDALVAAARGGETGAGSGELSTAGAIARRLGLPPGKKVALYVPTWRDNLHDDAGRYLLDFRLDLDEAARRLGQDWVLLIRGHHLMAGGLPETAVPEFSIDVTGYPDIGDLLVVADVLITDYSSVMFDFAPSGRPMLFFTYDLAQYRDQTRGFYFDFEADAPGPLLATSDQVVSALADLDAVAAKYEGARAAFTARFCPLDDGKASVRACDRIFGS